jgi:hypothetical protein
MSLKSLLPSEAKKIGNRYFLNADGDAVYSGIYLGEDQGNVFVPSLAFLKMSKLPSIVVNNANAWQFSCGKHLTDVISDEGGDLVLVKTTYNEIIGLAERQSKKFRNLWDVGYLLRREMDIK